MASFPFYAMKISVAYSGSGRKQKYLYPFYLCKREKEREKRSTSEGSSVSAIVAERGRPRDDDGTINRSPSACHVRSSPVVRWRRGEDKELGAL